ncbi:Mov34/MPN/PAD-1 family protein [Skermanella mucosa]|uniref:Mov34/MPN/PAD-1 family protein n=1 Tax=Skermanella mucosa TaxID=1789672 RepID=UPI00192A8655|nr:Mov34/MPN/PAD-1 family protein [Skermanella mucosa]UEM18979.1 Mov34/MPN/PAD-1 family protein [Skermanella mucosa]
MYPELIPEINAHVLAEYPREACGIIYHNGERAVYKACPNIHPEPEKAFRINARIIAPLQRDRKLRAVVHSHTNGQFHPSRADMESQIKVGCSYAIVVTDGENCSRPVYWGDDVPIPPYDGREFRHGPSGSDGRGDCYSLIRDHYFQELGIRLPEYPRDADWWLDGLDLYSQFAGDAGFVQVSLTDIQEHDCVLMSILNKNNTANHGAVYLGHEKGTLRHHLGHRLSHSEDPLYKWQRQIHSVWRHKSMFKPEQN